MSPVSRLVPSGLRLMAAAFTATLLFSSCRPDPRESIALLRGTLAWSRGDWNAASSRFLPLVDSRDATARDYALYALATTYLSQGEPDAALQRLASVPESSDPHLRASALYQAGVIAYNREEYGMASGLFRSVLEIESGALDAKINLELSKRGERKSEKARELSRAPLSRLEDGVTGQEDEIFDFIREKEGDRWKSKDSAGQGPAVRDH